MVAAIGEPFLLSHYDSHRKDSSTSPRQAVYVTHERSSGSKAKDGCVTITVQGDGVHIFDVTSFQFLRMHKYKPLNSTQLSHLHVAGSYTLGPSTTYAGPSVSRIITENGARLRRIYAVIEESPGVRNEHHGRTIWMWDDTQTSESSGVAHEKKSSITVRR